jgi:uncharacterized damage-inducible protein DinB
MLLFRTDCSKQREADMDSLMAVLADYNAAANRDLAKALGAIPEAERARDRGSYYKSLDGLLSHIAGGELFSLRNLAAALPGKPALAEPLIKTEMKPGCPVFPGYEASKNAIAAFDAALVALAGSLTEAELAVTADVHGSSQSVSRMLSSAFAHAAHHRGQVAQVLDEMGIQNDFFMAGIRG